MEFDMTCNIHSICTDYFSYEQLSETYFTIKWLLIMLGFDKKLEYRIRSREPTQIHISEIIHAAVYMAARTSYLVLLDRQF